MSKKVVLSAGHSLHDSGAVSKDPNYDLKENFLTIRIVELAIPLLKSHGVKADVIPDDLSLVQTINYINTNYSEHDLAIEVHVNAGGGTGIEAWHYHNSEPSKKLSLDLVNNIVAETGLPSRGIKDEYNNRWGRLGFVHDTKPLASLIEMGFIDHPVDLKLLASEEGRYKMAKGLARGICAYLGITWDPEKLPEKADDACQERIKDLEKEAKKQEARAEEWKEKTRNEREDHKKEIEEKEKQYNKLLEFSRELENQLGDKKEAYAVLLRAKNDLQKTFDNLEGVTLPDMEKRAENAEEALEMANKKIERLLATDYTLLESIHFLIKALRKGAENDQA